MTYGGLLTGVPPIRFGEPAVTVGSAWVGSLAICGASLTLVIWIFTVASLAEVAPQRSVADTVKVVERTSEPSLTKRSPVVEALAVSSEALSVWPTVTSTHCEPL